MLTKTKLYLLCAVFHRLEVVIPVNEFVAWLDLGSAGTQHVLYHMNLFWLYLMAQCEDYNILGLAFLGGPLRTWVEQSSLLLLSHSHLCAGKQF